MIVSMIFVTFNSADVIENCLRSLDSIRLPEDVSLEIFVVDNNSSDSTAKIVMGLSGKNTRFFRNPRNVGLSKATNYAFKMSSGDYIVLANPDIVFNQDLAKFISYGIQTHADAIIGPALLNMDGSPQRWIHSQVTDMARMFFTFTTLGGYFDKFLTNHWFRRHYHYEGVMGGHYSVFQLGTCMMMSRDTVRRLELGTPYDERFPLFFGDVDLAYRARKANIRSLVITDVAFRHVGGHSFKNLHRMQRYTFIRDMIKFARIYRKHPSIVRLLFIVEATVAFPFLALTRGRSPRMWQVSIEFLAEQIRGLL